MKAANKLSLSVQYPDARLKESLTRARLRRWVTAALAASGASSSAELTLRFVEAREARALNRDYRGKDYATNVLTFAYEEAGDGSPAQADIVFCTDVLLREAKERGIEVEAHAAHLVVHGVLHAQGYDHEKNADAQEMEALERAILAKLGFGDP